MSMTTGTEAEKPKDNSSAQPPAGEVMVSGQLQNGIREVLEIVSSLKTVKHGVLRILSKEVRGHIGISDGETIVGAHATSSREHGHNALRELLVAQKGMFAFLSLETQQDELKQSLDVDLDELLRWNGGKSETQLNDALSGLLQRAPGSTSQSSSDQPTLPESKSSLAAPTLEQEEEEFKSYMAWGGELPAMSSSLSKLTKLAPTSGVLSGGTPMIPEKIYIPDVFDDGPSQPDAAGKQIEVAASSAAADEHVVDLLQQRPTGPGASLPAPLPAPLPPPPPPPRPPARQQASNSGINGAASAADISSPEGLAADLSAPAPDQTQMDPAAASPAGAGTGLGVAPEAPEPPASRVPPLPKFHANLVSPASTATEDAPTSQTEPGSAGDIAPNSEANQYNDWPDPVPEPTVEETDMWADLEPTTPAAPTAAAMPAAAQGKDWDLTELERIPTPTVASAAESVAAATGAQPDLRSFQMPSTSVPQPSGPHAFSQPAVPNKSESAPPSIQPELLRPPVPAESPQRRTSDFIKAKALKKDLSPDAAAAEETEEPRLAISQRMLAMGPGDNYLSEKPPASPANWGKRFAIVGSVLAIALSGFIISQLMGFFSYKSDYDTGIAALRKGSNDIARAAFSKCIQTNRQSTAAYFYRALSEARTGDNEGAAEDFDKVLAKDPKNVFALAGRCALKTAAKDYKMAIADAQAILTVDPSFTDGYRLRALALSKDKQYEEAIADCNAYLKSSPGAGEATSKAETMAIRAYCQFKLQHYGDALKDYTSAIDLNPNNASFYGSRAVCYNHNHDYKQGLADCSKAISIDGNDASFYAIRSRCYAGLGQSVKALADLEYVVRLAPNVESHRSRAVARLASHDFAGAVEDFEYIVSAAPKDKDAKAKLDQARASLAAFRKAQRATP